jgi:hypothetical protein
VVIADLRVGFGWEHNKHLMIPGRLGWIAVAASGASPSYRSCIGAEHRLSPFRVEHHWKLAGEENGFEASTTNISSECRFAAPLLETCIGVSAPWPTMD